MENQCTYLIVVISLRIIADASMAGRFIPTTTLVIRYDYNVTVHKREGFTIEFSLPNCTKHVLQISVVILAQH